MDVSQGVLGFPGLLRAGHLVRVTGAKAHAGQGVWRDLLRCLGQVATTEADLGQTFLGCFMKGT